MGSSADRRETAAEHEARGKMHVQAAEPGIKLVEIVNSARESVSPQNNEILVLTQLSCRLSFFLFSSLSPSFPRPSLLSVLLPLPHTPLALNGHRWASLGFTWPHQARLNILVMSAHVCISYDLRIRSNTTARDVILSRGNLCRLTAPQPFRFPPPEIFVDIMAPRDKGQSRA